jgi:hypothetical protein
MPLTHDFELFMLKRGLGVSVGSAPTVFKLKLYSSASVAPNVDSVVGDFTELANGNGYTTNGKDLTFSSFTITAGSGDTNTNMSYAAPVDLAEWNLYEDTYYQIKGTKKEIENFNSREVGTYKLS